VLGSFGTDCERFRDAPQYDFLLPPHPGKLWYECLCWPMTGEKWRELAQSALSDRRKLGAHQCG
jgi:hypothetical protein